MVSDIRVAVIDGHPLFMVGVTRALCDQGGFEIVACATSAADAVQIAAHQTPDVMLIDANMRGGIAAAQEVAHFHPATKVIMLTASAEELQATWVTLAGARSWVLKNATAAGLAGAIRNAFRGNLYVSAGLSARIAAKNDRLIETQGDSVLSILTAREVQVMLHVCSGLSNKEVADLIGLCEPTVKTYMTNIMRKLKVHNRSEAAMIVLRDHPSPRQYN